MAQVEGSVSTPPPAPTSGQFVVTYLRELRRWINQNKTVAGAGLTTVQTQSGRVLSVVKKKGATTPPHPWKVTRADHTPEGGGPTVNRIRVHPGSIAGIIPTNILSPITYTPTSGSLQYVVNTITADESAITTCTLSVENDEPIPPLPTEGYAPTEIKDLIALILDDTIYQIRFSNLSAIPILALVEDTVEVSPFRENVIRYYNWEIRE